MKYYVRLGTESPQIRSALEVYQLIREGRVTKDTAACEVGAAQWSTLGQLVPGLFEPNAVPPMGEHGAGTAAVEMMGKAGHFLAEHTGEVAGLSRVFARRILVSNFTQEHALPEERAELEKAVVPVKSPMAQNYVAWRRAMLWVSGVALGLAAILGLSDTYSEMTSRGNSTVLRMIALAGQIVHFAAPALLIVAALRWSNIKLSKRAGRWAWLCAYVGPLAILAIPVTQLSTDREVAQFLVDQQHKMQKAMMENVRKKMDGENRAMVEEQLAQLSKADFAAQVETALKQMGSNKEVAAEAQKALGLLIAFKVGVTLTPLVFGLFPGIVRASLTLRTLVPESPLPGSIIAIVEPLFALLLFVGVAVAIQAGNAPILLGMLALLCSPILLLKNIKAVTTPMSESAMSAHLKPLRVRLMACTSVGMVLLISGSVEALEYVDDVTIAATALHLVGNILLLTVVGADFFLALMKFSFDQDKALRPTPLYTDMERRFADLQQVRLTQLVDIETAPPPPTPTAVAT